MELTILLRTVVKPVANLGGGCRCIAPPPAPLSHFVFNLQPRGAWGGFHGGASSRGALAPAAPLLASPLQSSINHSHIDHQSSYIPNHKSCNRNHKNTSNNSSRNTTSRIYANWSLVKKGEEYLGTLACTSPDLDGPNALPAGPRPPCQRPPHRRPPCSSLLLLLASVVACTAIAPPVGPSSWPPAPSMAALLQHRPSPDLRTLPSWPRARCHDRDLLPPCSTRRRPAPGRPREPTAPRAPAWPPSCEKEERDENR
jgi:hypothetical protein